MKEFIDYLVKQIVKHPDKVSVDEAKEGSDFVYTVSASPEDMGTIIGKKGRNINSLRNMAKVKAIKDEVHIRIEVKDSPQDAQV